MKPSVYGKVSGGIFLLVAIAHGYRAIAGAPVVIGGWDLPVWMSGVAAVVAVLLAVWGFRQQS